MLPGSGGAAAERLLVGGSKGIASYLDALAQFMFSQVHTGSPEVPCT